jgi:uncharacterized membrane protein (UPF0136 family)
MNEAMVIWIYVALLIGGGLVGFLKAGSKVSLIVSVACAIPLILCNLNVFPLANAKWILVVLLALFTWRLIKSKKFMPSGMLLVATLLAIAIPRIWR